MSLPTKLAEGLQAHASARPHIGCSEKLGDLAGVASVPTSRPDTLEEQSPLPETTT